MIEQSSVFDAARRGYSELSFASEEEILHYFSKVETDSVVGHASNIKGILFEQQVTDYLNNAGVEAALFEVTNHPDTDIAINMDGYLPLEMQLKATDNTSYINQALADNPDIPILTTSELATKIDNTMVLDSGIENIELENAVFESIFMQQLSNMSYIPGYEQNLNDSELDMFAIDFNEFTNNSIVEDGLVEAVTDLAIPVSPIGVLLGLFGLPFI